MSQITKEDLVDFFNSTARKFNCPEVQMRKPTFCSQPNTLVRESVSSHDRELLWKPGIQESSNTPHGVSTLIFSNSQISRPSQFFQTHKILGVSSSCKKKKKKKTLLTQIGIFLSEGLPQKNAKLFFSPMEKTLKGERPRGSKKVCCLMPGNAHCTLPGKFIVFPAEFKMMWW